MCSDQNGVKMSQNHVNLCRRFRVVNSETHSGLSVVFWATRWMQSAVRCCTLANEFIVLFLSVSSCLLN